MLEQFTEINFRRSTREIIEQANEIIEEYQGEGLVLTLRQLYYQFVARDILENKQRNYDRLGKIITDARMAGMMDWDAIEDRTRFLRGNTTWRSPLGMLNYYARNYKIDMWANQDTRVEVWIEKDALVGVIEQVCMENDVDFFACRGYVSASELYNAGKRMGRRWNDENVETIVLHLGDHDPSGIDMTRDNQERLSLFAGYYVQVERIALNMTQVEQYSPPPNFAKQTDSRHGEYAAMYGENSWELDALEPRVIRDLINEHVDEHRDPDLWAEREQVLNAHQDILRDTQSYVQDRLA